MSFSESDDIFKLLELTQAEITALLDKDGLYRNSTTGNLEYNGSGIGGAPSGSAGGDLNGTYPNPSVKAITETSGPTSLVIGDIADGEIVKRVGSTLVGFDIEIPICPFGAKSDSKGKFLIANGISTLADDSSKPRTRQPIPINGTIVGIAYKTKDGNTTTQMKLHIDGVVEETITLSSMNGNGGGVEYFSGPIVSAADNYAEIEYDDNQKPGECTMTLIIKPT